MRDPLIGRFLYNIRNLDMLEPFCPSHCHILLMFIVTYIASSWFLVAILSAHHSYLILNDSFIGGNGG